MSTGYDGIIPALMTDKFDMIGSGMTLTQERNLRLNFSDPFIVVGQTLLIRKELEGTIKSYKDLNTADYRITSKLGTTGEMVAKKLISKAKYHGYDNEQEAVLDVVNGKADAFIYDAPYNVVAVNKVGAGKLVFLDKPFTYEPLAFGLKKGDYVAEIIRSGVQSIARGQNEAARSLGLSAGQSMRHVVLPQALKRVLPPLAGQFISLVKDTSLVSVIAITELLKSGREVITTSFSPFEILFCVAGLYLLINLPLSKIANRLERRLAQSD
ncbi:hypothetical protein J2W17_003423 [Pseudomonas lini]|nr:hypothetical protein [Pseudomonas lini]